MLLNAQMTSSSVSAMLPPARWIDGAAYSDRPEHFSQHILGTGRGWNLAEGPGRSVEHKGEEGMKTQKRRGNGLVHTVETFALGAAIGSLVALLFAPASGRVTRKRIGLKVRALRQSTTKRLGKMQRQLAQKAEDLRENAADTIQGARQWIVRHAPSGNNGKHPARAAHHA